MTDLEKRIIDIEIGMTTMNVLSELSDDEIKKIINESKYGGVINHYNDMLLSRKSLTRRIIENGELVEISISYYSSLTITLSGLNLYPEHSCRKNICDVYDLKRLFIKSKYQEEI